MHDILHFLNRSGWNSFDYSIVAERGKERDSDRIWFPEIPFLEKYTTSYKLPSATRSDNTDTPPILTNKNASAKEEKSPKRLQPIPFPKYSLKWTLEAVIRLPRWVVKQLLRIVRRTIRGIKVIGMFLTGTAHPVVWRYCAKLLIKHCRELEPIDVFHIVRPNKTSSTIAAELERKNPNLRIVVGPNLMAYGAPGRSFNISDFQNRAIKSFLSVSSYHSKLLKEFGIRPELIHRLPPSVDPYYFSPTADTTDSERDPCLRILFAASQLSVEKGVDEFLQALALITKQNLIEFRALIIGSEVVNRSVQTPYSKHLRDEVGDRVDFIGTVDRQNMAEFYRKANIFIHCGEPENGPTTIIESLSVGTPCILTDHLCFKEPELESNCLYYQKGDIEELVEKIYQASAMTEDYLPKRYLPDISHTDTIEFLDRQYTNR